MTAYMGGIGRKDCYITNAPKKDLTRFRNSLDVWGLVERSWCEKVSGLQVEWQEDW